MPHGPARFFLRTALFAALAGSTLWLASLAADRGLRRSQHSYFAGWNALYAGRINADLLILGNSHSHVGLSPALLDSGTDGRSYNLAIDGYQFDMQQARYRAYRQHNRKPRLIIQGLDYFIFDSSGWLYDVPQFLPHLNCDTGLQRALLISGMPQAYRWLPFLKYREQRHALLRGWCLAIGRPESNPELYDRGYAPKDLPFYSADYRRKLAGPALHPEYKTATFHRFAAFLAQCREEQIPVLLVMTPQYAGLLRHYRFRESFHAAVDSVAARNGAFFLDMSLSSVSDDSTNFYIASHLSRRGAEQFSRELGRWLHQSGLR